jgi:phenylalanyl-tRNA synthetase alpha chain
MADLKESLEEIRNRFMTEIENVDRVYDLEQIKVKYLGKKGELTQVLRGMGSLSADERPIAGQMANKIREELEEMIDFHGSILSKREKAEQLANDR